MSEDSAPTQHEMANAKQKIASLKSALKRAADELDALADSAEDAAAIERARQKAEIFRKAAES